jgi:hypothetical protein
LIVAAPSAELRYLTEVDHRDRNPLNDRWENIRPATRTQNLWNRKRPKNNTSGFKGVSSNQGRWLAMIGRAGRNCYLGRFDTREEASAAYLSEASRLHGEFFTCAT